MTKPDETIRPKFLAAHYLKPVLRGLLAALFIQCGTGGLAAAEKAGLETAKQSMKHESSVVRTSAVNALAALGGDAATEEIFTFFKSAETR